MNMLKKLIAISSTLIILMFLSSNVLANENTVYWDGEGEDNRWMNPMNWSNNKVPQSGDNVVLDGRCTKNIEINKEDKIEIKALTIEEEYTGTVTANSPNTFRIKNELLIKGGNILWKQTAENKRIAFEGDVRIKGGFVELIGTYRVFRNFIWEDGSLSVKDAIFDIYVSNVRYIDAGNNQLIVKSININHGISPIELQFKGNIRVNHEFKNDVAVDIHVLEDSILDLSRINKNINRNKFIVDSGSKVLIMDKNSRSTLNDLKDIYYSAAKNVLVLEGEINDIGNHFTLKYNIDTGKENILLEFLRDKKDKNFKRHVVLPKGLEEGKHTINIWGEDDRGFCFHVGQVYFYIDNTPPQGSIRTSNKDDTNKELLIFLTAEDAGGSGLSKISLPNGTNKTVSGTVYEMVYTARTNDVYQFKISDHAGNSSEVYTVIDDIDDEVGEPNEDKEDKELDEETDKEPKEEEETENEEVGKEPIKEDKKDGGTEDKDDGEKDEAPEDDKIDEEKGKDRTNDGKTGRDKKYKENTQKENENNNSFSIKSLEDFKLQLDILRKLIIVFQKIFSLRIEDFGYGLSG